jgi:ribosomal protein S27E
MFLVCWNHDCRETYDANSYSPKDLDVKCEKCGGTLISPSGKVQISGLPHAIKTVRPSSERKRRSKAKR